MNRETLNVKGFGGRTLVCPTFNDSRFTVHWTAVLSILLVKAS